MFVLAEIYVQDEDGQGLTYYTRKYWNVTNYNAMLETIHYEFPELDHIELTVARDPNIFEEEEEVAETETKE